ncbi:amino acid permease [Lachnospiraceae bacterium]|nr:amino acid permease [Lachnospiraceae bacterium]
MLTVICVVFVAEAAAPVAAIGNSQFFWWIVLIFTFLLPYGLIAAELGTTYESEGGMCDWAERALGRRWGARTAWYYWVNFQIWMTSLAVMVPELINYMFGIELGTVPYLISVFVFIWVVTLISTSPVSENIWILNIGGIVKIALALALGIFGLYTGVTKGFANPMTVSSLFPHSLGELSFISVVLFNFLGFEVVCTFADSMENPKKQIPQAIMVGGLVIAAVYMFSSFGIGVGIPIDEISTSSGIVDAFQAMTGTTTGLIISVAAGLFLVTLLSNMISWFMGVNNVVTFVLKDICGSMGMTEYIVAKAEPFLFPSIFPAMVFVLGAVLAFSTGSDWGMSSIITPIVFPLGAVIGANPVLIMAAVISGGTFGSHACFYSDVTLLAAQSAGIDSMEHALSQLPYNAIACGLSIIGFIVTAAIL